MSCASSASILRAFFFLELPFRLKSFVRNTCEEDSRFAQFYCKFVITSYLESALA